MSPVKKAFPRCRCDDFGIDASSYQSAGNCAKPDEVDPGGRNEGVLVKDDSDSHGVMISSAGLSVIYYIVNKVIIVCKESSPRRRPGPVLLTN